MSPRKPKDVPAEAERITSLERAAKRHEREGSLLKAIADCKRILLLDPDHPGTAERMEALCERLHGQTQSAGPRAPVSWMRGAPLDDLVLGDVMPETPAIALDYDMTAQPMVEIYLDRAVPEEDPARRLAADTLPRTPLFSALDGASLRQLLEGVEVVELDAEQELFHQGDPGSNCLYVIAEGAVVPIAEGETRKKLAVLEEGDFFGEISLVTERPRSATIEALVDTKLLAIPRGLLAELVERQPAVLEVLLRYLRDRLIDRLVRTSPFFTALPREERDDTARRCRFIEMGDGAVLVRQGQPAPGLFALLAGRVAVIHSDGVGDKHLANLEPGDIFGEMSMLSGEPAVASCVAQVKSWALVLPQADFHELIGSRPRVAETVRALAEERRSANETAITEGRYLDGQLDLV